MKTSSRFRVASGAALLAIFSSLFLPGTSARAGTEDDKKEVIQKQEDLVTLDDLEVENTYTFASRFHDHDLGGQDSLFDSVQYLRRIPLVDKWYLALGGDYSRFDFGASPSTEVPNRLQEAEGIIGLQYVVEDHAAIDLEVHPGVYYAGHASARAFDAPVLAYIPFKLSNTLFLEIGIHASMMQNPPVVPVGGIVWLINDKTTLEAIFPKPKISYSLTNDLSLWAGAEIAGNDYKTDVSASLPHENPGVRNSVVQYSEMRGGGGLEYTGIKPLDISVAGGYSFYRDFDYYRIRTDIRADGAPYLQITMGAHF